MMVHAHPDDETTKAGATSAWLAARGVRTVLVCCTDGSAGEVTDTALLQGRPLAEVRSAELAAAASILGFASVHELGFADSGYEGQIAHGFASVALETPVSRLLEVFEEESPDVVITYDPVYAVAHPDHARCHEITAAAFAASAHRETGPRKLYGTRTHSVARLTAFDEWLRSAGRLSPYRKAIEAATPENFTTRVNVGEHVLTARTALREHRTQVAHDHPWFYCVPDDMLVELYPWEDHELLATRPGITVAGHNETDVLAGLL